MSASRRTGKPIPLARMAAVLACGLAVQLAAAGAGAVEGGKATPAPAVAYFKSGQVRVATAGGDPISILPDMSSMSLGGGLIAGADFDTAWKVTGYGARKGGTRFTISAAIQPTVLDPAGRVAFWGVHPRDLQNNSVWVREVNGSIHKVVQFSNGGSLPGYDAGFDGDGTILSTSFDRDGSIIALTQGNDADLFVYDVFTVDVASGAVDRITANQKSRWAAVSPSGSRIAWQREVSTCGSPYIRAAQIVVADIDGSDRRVAAKGSCDGWLGGARWVSSHEVVAYATKRVGPGEFRTNLVLVDVVTGERERLTHSGVVSFFSADPRSNRVAFMRDGVRGFTILDLDMCCPVHFRHGYLPHLAGDRGTL